MTFSKRIQIGAVELNTEEDRGGRIVAEYVDNTISEELLAEWIKVTSVIQNARIVRYLTYNEALVCNYLWHRLDSETDYLTPTQLCKMTGITKSLMNRIIKSLEEKKLIEYIRLENDRRLTPVRFNREKEAVFLKVHNNSIDIVDRLVEVLGREKSERILEALRDITAGAEAVLMSGIIDD